LGGKGHGIYAIMPNRNESPIQACGEPSENNGSPERKKSDRKFRELDEVQEGGGFHGKRNAEAIVLLGESSGLGSKMEKCPEVGYKKAVGKKKTLPVGRGHGEENVVLQGKIFRAKRRARTHPDRKKMPRAEGGKTAAPGEGKSME